jgi:hypothetical protein
LERPNGKHVSMMKKSALIPSCGYWNHCRHTHLSPLASRLTVPPVRRRSHPSQPQSKRFAHVLHRSPSLDPEEDLNWPSTPNFSPYELFKQDRNGPYCKHRFYKLVKLYHPDRQCTDHPACKGLSDAARLERYRLIVAANELLSDPAKRAAYDRYGVGWHKLSQHADSWSSAFSHTQSSGPREDPDSIFNNATWEDWEQWRQRKEGRTQAPTIVSHQTFAVFVVLVSLFVGTAQAVAIGKHSSLVEERSNALNQKCGRFLEERRHEARAQTEPGERIQNFLIRRDPSGHGLNEQEQELYRHHLGPRAERMLDQTDEPRVNLRPPNEEPKR